MSGSDGQWKGFSKWYDIAVEWIIKLWARGVWICESNRNTYIRNLIKKFYVTELIRIKRLCTVTIFKLIAVVMGNEHWNYMCLCICVYCFTQPLNLTDLGENHLWVKRIQYCRNTEHLLISKLKYSILRNTKTPSCRLGVGCGHLTYFRTILVFNQRFNFRKN